MRRTMRDVMLLAAVLLASGCASGHGNGCRIFAPIFPTESDLVVMSDELAVQLRDHNATGERVCGWSP